MLSEKTFKTIFNNAVDGVLVFDVNRSRIFLANKIFCKMIGYEEEELKNLTINDLHRQEDISFVMERFTRQISGELKISRDIPLKRKDGCVFYSDIHGIEIHSDGSKYLLAIIRDVSDRKQIEDELSFKTTLLETQLETTIDGILVVDNEGNTILHNQRFVNMWRIPKEHIESKNDKILLEYAAGLLREPEIFINKVEHLYSHKEEDSRDEIELKEGRVFDRYSAPMTDHNGKYIGRIWYFRDITDFKKAEEALKNSEEKYKALVEGAGETIAVVDNNGVFLFMNTIAARRLGGETDDYIGKTMWDLFPENIADQQIAAIREVIKNRETNVAVGPSIVQGIERWYETTMTPLKNNKSNVPVAMIIARDITELRKTQQELNTYREEMAHAERLASLGTLSATAAHELTQPLTVIRLLIENAMTKLQNTSSPEAVIDKLRESLIEISNITSVVNRFRNFARKSSEKIIREVNLQTISNRIVNLLKESSLHSGVELVIEDMDGLPHVFLNEKDIEQMFFALIDNAIHAAGSKKNCRIVISGVELDDCVELRFSDNCCGIAPENLERIFQPFFTTKPQGQGTGLGLCIVQGIVSRAGGKIRVESELDEGSTFFVTLPLNKEMK